MKRSLTQSFQQAMRDRAGPLRHLPALFSVAWSASPALTIASIALRLLRATVPALMLYVAKLIIDAVVAGRSDPGSAAAASSWLGDPRHQYIALLVAIELALALASDLLGRATNLVDGILAEMVGNTTTMHLMAHAATLDLEQFEDAAVQDRLERARRQVTWRSNLIGKLLGQAQDLVTAISLAAVVTAVLPWLVILLVLALIPAFLNELRFNDRSYQIAYRRSPDRRESDYLRYLGAGTESAKEVKQASELPPSHALNILRYRAFVLYGYCGPSSTARPPQPEQYSRLEWCDPVGAGVDRESLERRLRERLAKKPKDRITKSVARCGWAFSDARPDANVFYTGR